MALTDEQMVRLRKRLEDELRRLNVDARFTQQAFVDAGTEYDEQFRSSGNHPAETATETFDQEHQLAIENMLTTTREQVLHALARMDEGTYGICEVCGKEIPVARLEAVPHATLCIDDQGRQDPAGDPRYDNSEGLRPV